MIINKDETDLNLETPREAFGAFEDDILAVFALNVGFETRWMAVERTGRRRRRSALLRTDGIAVHVNSQEKEEDKGQAVTLRHLPDKMRRNTLKCRRKGQNE